MSAFVCVCVFIYGSPELEAEGNQVLGDLLGVFSVALAVVPRGQAPSLMGSITPHPHDFLICCSPGKAPVRGVSLETLWWPVALRARWPQCQQNSLDSGNFSLI